MIKIKTEKSASPGGILPGACVGEKMNNVQSYLYMTFPEFYMRMNYSAVPLLRYYAVSFLPNPLKIHPLAHPLGRGMGSILWVQTLKYTLHQ